MFGLLTNKNDEQFSKLNHRLDAQMAAIEDLQRNGVILEKLNKFISDEITKKELTKLPAENIYRYGFKDSDDAIHILDTDQKPIFNDKGMQNLELLSIYSYGHGSTLYAGEKPSSFWGWEIWHNSFIADEIIDSKHKITQYKKVHEFYPNVKIISVKQIVKDGELVIND